MTVRRFPLRGVLVLATIAAPALLVGQDATTVAFERQGYRLTALGAKVTVSARVLDARRRAVPNAAIAYRSSDPTVASVTGAGIVQSKKVGRTRVWAVSGRDSASALIMVDQWATTFAFSPSPVTMEAIGVQVPLQIQLRDAGGHAIPDAGKRASQCRVRDDKVAALAPNGRVVAKANGITWLRCVDRGVSDSVRVEVRQRAMRVQIADKLAVGAKTVPDMFALQMRAMDAKGDVIETARATWASLTPTMVTVDPNGRAQAVGPGLARIVAQVGDATDTVSITVTGTAIASVADAAAAAATENAVKEPKVELDQIAPFVGDSVRITFVAKDPLGAAVTNADRDVKLRSTNDSVITVNSQSHWAKVKTEGSAWIVAQFTYSGIAVKDSIMISPRVRNAASANASAAAATARQNAFERPKFNLDSAQARNIRQLDSALTSIRESGIGKSTTGRTIGLEFITAQASHATRLSDTYSESRSGLLFGGIATATPFRRVALSTAFRTGKLTDAKSTVEELKVTELDLQGGLWLSSWFGVGAGYMMRGERTDIGFASWTAANASVLLKGSFIGNFVTTNASLSFFPVAKLKARPDKPEITSLAGDFGMDLRFGFATAGFRYYVENFKFPADPITGDKRSDQFSTLRFRIGTMIGR
jgi:hypothetical protein